MSDPPRETHKVIRAVCILLVAIAVVACAMAVKGWQIASFMLAGVIVLMAGLLVIQVTRALLQLRRHSLTLRQASASAEEHYLGVLRRMIRFVEARDTYTRGRSERIGKLAEMIARRLNLSADMCALMNLAGQVHDIGLLAVPEGILNKRTTLGADEFRTVKKHSEVSYEVLKPLQSFAAILPAIRYHHERMNGTGYPAGLTGEEIPVEARVLAVADAYDAMTHDRPHRAAMTPLDAMRELRRCTPAGYDESCVNALAEIVNLSDLQAAMGSEDAGATSLEETALASACPSAAAKT